MKKLFLMGFTAAALLFGYSNGNAQQQDSASVNYNTRSATEEAQQGAENLGDEMREGAENAGEQVREGAQSTRDEIEQSAQDASNTATGTVTEQELEQATDELAEAWKGSKVDAFVGPKGEKVFMKGNKYYYYNDDGKRVRVKPKHLQDNTGIAN